MIAKIDENTYIELKPNKNPEVQVCEFKKKHRNYLVRNQGSDFIRWAGYDLKQRK